MSFAETQRLAEPIDAPTSASFEELDRLTALEHAIDDDRYRLTMDLAAVGIAHVGTRGEFLEMNQAVCAMLGYTREELLHLTVYDLSANEDVSATDDVRRQLRSGQVSSFYKEKRYVRKDGTIVWVGLTVAARRDGKGKVLYDIAMMKDITWRVDAEEALRRSEARFKQLTELSSDWFWESDTSGLIRTFEGAGFDDTTTVAGLTAEDLGVLPLPDKRTVSELIAARKRFRDQLFTAMVDGRTLHVSISGEPIIESDGEFSGFHGVARNITERVEADEQIRFLATHDSLTKLPNRAMFIELLSNNLTSARRYDRRLAVAFVDLDGFKAMNDTFGHAAGDAVLCEVATRLRSTVRDSDVVSRLGGDEFVVLLQGWKSDADLRTVADKMLRCVAQPISIGDHECQVSASIGMARYPDDATDTDMLLQNADTAMYEAKATGKNQFHMYRPASDSD